MLHPFDLILRKASDRKSSDIHLKVGLPPIIRVEGNLYYLAEDFKDPQMSRLSQDDILKFANALMNEKQKLLFENGAEVDLGYDCLGVRFRIHICWQKSLPRIICRYIPEKVPTLEELMLPLSLMQFTELQRGLVLVTGATGSGKTTTLASLVDAIARSRSCHIVTLEDPIEFVLKDRKSIITQREIGHDTSSFSNALKYVLRQDPDVIFIGELRDEESILMALNAAETGHLVLSSLHTNDASEAVYRMLGNVSNGYQETVRQQLANVLMGVVSQRLIPRADGKGRIAATEIFIQNARTRDIIRDKERTSELRVVLEEGFPGMRTFDQSLLELYEKGIITKQEALVNCTNFQDFTLRLNGVTQGFLRSDEELQELTRLEQIEQMLENEEKVIEIDSTSGFKKIP